jgi:hypothetical protein
VEQGSQAVRLDCDGRIHHGETLPLPADVGEDPARLHQSQGPETKEIGVHLFHGHYTSALGGVHDPRARDLLWNFVNRSVLTEQSLIVITWFKNPADLPRLATLLEARAKGDPKDRTYASLPYAIHRAYGDAALPVLESAIQKSDYVWVQTNCARELVQAGRRSGFAFIAQAIEQNKFYRREMVQFVQDRFPELRGAHDSKVLAFLKARQ